MKRLSHIICLFLSLTAVSCVREDFPYEALDEAVETVEVSLDLFVARESAGTAETKAIDDPADVSATKIRNINILQFDGTDESAPIVGEVRYLSDEADPNDEERYLNLDKIRLADSQGKKHTVIILTNTFTKLPQVDNLGEMKAFMRHIENEKDMFGHNGDGLDFPDKGETEFYQRLNAIAVTEITNGTILKGALRRSMARLNINIENTGVDNLVIHNVQLCNVSQKDWYLTDYRYIDGNGAEQKLFEETFQDTYDPADPKRIDYSLNAWNGNPDGTGKASYTFYVPSNQRGVHASNTLPQEKNRCPNTDGATYIRITGYYGASHDIPIVYTFYLGGNLYNDFNLKPNTSYTFNLKIDGKGDHISDDRIEDMATVNFNVDANCYILTPPPLFSRSYTFNAIHRSNIFWGSRYGMESLYPNYTIDATKNWKAMVLWSDFEMSQEDINAFLVRKSGNGSGNYMSDAQRIKVKVPAGMKGNVIIGMYIDSPENILWSWHLWITDYQPDNIEKHAPIDGKFIYPVTGGEVHRYNGASWNSENGKYRNGYIMDRNLGAYDQLNHNENGGDGLFYQYGRKDPFNYKGYSWKYDVNGVGTRVYSNTSISFSSDALSSYNGSHVAYAVNHPMLQIIGKYYWTIGDIFNPDPHDSKIIWQDPYNNVRTDNEENRSNSDKSIFDPCPPGWRVPETPWSTDFYGDNKGASTTNEKVNCQYIDDPKGRGKGRVYFPNGYLASKDNPDAPAIIFPFIGYDGHYHSANTHNVSIAYPMEVAGHRILQTDISSSSKASIYYVRCIRENY